MKNKFSQIILLIYGISWLVGGLIYTATSMVSPASFSHSILYTPELASQFIQKLQPYWPYYAISFTILIIADTARMLLGLAFRQIFGTHFYTNTAVFCFFAAGLIGVILNINLLVCWLLIGTFKLSPEVLENFWSTFLIAQYLGTLLLAWGFFMLGCGVYLIYKTSKQSKVILGSRWIKWTLIIFWLDVMAVIATIYSLITNEGLPIVLIIMIFTVFAAPIWSLMLVYKLNNKPSLKS